MTIEERTRQLRALLLILLVVYSLLSLAIVGLKLEPATFPRSPTVWEDGSFTFWTVSGCLPFMPCS